MKKFLLLAMMVSCGIAFGQYEITGTTEQTIDFNSFDGSGFAATPSAGQLDSDNWKITGMSDGTSDFGATSSGDFARGTSTGGVSSGGTYAFEIVTSTDYILGFQPTAGDFTPGAVILKIQNKTGSTISSLEVSYEIHSYNNGDRENSLNFSHSDDDVSYTDVSALDYTTTATLDASPSWVRTDKSTTISTSITANDFFYLRWSSDDVSGSGSRDEFGIDDIKLTATTSGGPTAVVGFDESSSSETETNSSFSTSIPVTLSNYGSSQVDLSVSVSGGTAESADYTLNTSSLSFNSSATQNISIDINPDAGFNDETIQITIAETSSTGISISPSIHTITVTDDETPSLVINEYQADPDVSNGDANNDGVISSTEDEFVEIVNTGGTNLDISNWVLADAGSDTHTFDDPTVLAPGQAIVVFGGGSPTGSFGGSLVQVASGLSLNNSGDNIILKTDGGDEILNISFSSTEGGANQSYTLDADLVGSYTQHSSATGSGGALFSPGTKIDGSVFVSTASITWDGSEDNDWDNPDNWDGGVIPSSNDNVVIADVSNDPILSSGDHAAVNNLTVNTGAVLSVDSGGSLAIFGTVTNNGTCYFEKALGDNGYSIIGSPVSGETIDALGTDHFYSNTNGSGFSSNLKNSTDVMAPGKGYFAAYDGASQYPVFDGTPNSSDVTYTPVASSGFELIANPYTAAISTTKFLSDNSSVITGGVYFWDDGGSNVGGDRGGDYITVTAMGAASAVQPSGSDDGVAGNKGDSRAENGYIPSGQGVFVEVTSTSDITFSQTQQVIVPGSNDDSNYYREGDYQKVKLAISGNGLYNEVLVGLGEDATYGVDRLLDSKKFSSGSALSFYSMIEDEKYVIQGLPLAYTESVNTKLGFDLSEEGTYKMGVVDFENIPEGINVTLIDHLTGSTYDLRETEFFTFISEEVVNDQRFELQFSPMEVLSSDESLSGLTVFGSTSELTIQTELNGAHEVTIYSLDGKITFKKVVSFKNGRALISKKLTENEVYVLKVGEESFKFVIK